MNTHHASEDLQAAARLALSCLDLTELGEACTAADVDRLCERAQGRAASGAVLLPVAAVCVWPAFAAQARRQLPVGIAVAGVVNFPSGDEPIEAVREQIAQLRAAGAQEVDCVLPWKALLAGDEAHCAQVLAQVREASQGMVLKLILESGALERDDAIARACVLGLRAGVDFLKTSTGKIPRGASLAAARTMLNAIAADPRRDRLGFKPSGGLRTVADVQPYLAAVESILGAGALVPSRFRIGASGLWNDIAQVLGAAPPPAAANTTY